jgi:hypothetical protein
VAHAGTTQAEVERSVLPVGVGAEVGGEPTASANASVDIAAADKVGRWSHDGISFGTSGELFRTELP